MKAHSNCVSRRQLFALGSAAATSLAISPQSDAAEPVRSIDAHVHVWTPDVDKYPLDKDFAVADMQPVLLKLADADEDVRGSALTELARTGDERLEEHTA